LNLRRAGDRGDPVAQTFPTRFIEQGNFRKQPVLGMARLLGAGAPEGAHARVKDGVQTCAQERVRKSAFAHDGAVVTAVWSESLRSQQAEKVFTHCRVMLRKLANSSVRTKGIGSGEQREQCSDEDGLATSGSPCNA
jgi:hypothetical protein